MAFRNFKTQIEIDTNEQKKIKYNEATKSNIKKSDDQSIGAVIGGCNNGG
jgi:hypothetical protein